MRFYYASFTGQFVVAAGSSEEALGLVSRQLAKMHPGIMNAAFGVDEKPANSHLIGVSCKTIYPDGSISDCVPFPHSVDPGDPQYGQIK